MKKSLRQKKTKLTEKVCRLILTSGIRNDFVTRLLISALISQGRFNEIKELFSRMNVPDEHLMVKYFTYTGDFDRAEQLAQEVLKNNPDDCATAIHLVRNLIYREKRKEAALILSQYLPKVGKANFNRRRYIKLATFAHAYQLCRDSYRIWLDLEPENETALTGLASLLIDDGKMTEAAKYLERALALSSTKPSLALQLRKYIDTAADDDQKKEAFKTELSNKLEMMNKGDGLAKLIALKEETRRKFITLTKNNPLPERTKASCVCPIHRPEDIENAVTQLCRQDWPNLEYIISVNTHLIEDKDILALWPPEKSAPIIIDSRDAAGVSGTLNKAIRNASADIIMRFDADNIYFPSYARHMLSVIEATNADIVFKRSKLFYFKSDDLLIYKPLRHSIYNINEDPYIIGSGATFCFKKRIFENFSFDEKRLKGEDNQFLRRCLTAGYKLVISDPFDFISVRQEKSSMHTSDYPNIAITQEKFVAIGNSSHFQEVELFENGLQAA